MRPYGLISVAMYTVSGQTQRLNITKPVLTGHGFTVPAEDQA